MPERFGVVANPRRGKCLDCGRWGEAGESSCPCGGTFERETNAHRTVANHHPTVKPLALMRYLITLVTPSGGVVLDPFAGSGTTGVACAELGVPCILIEQSPEYCEIIARRVDHALDERAKTVRQHALEMVAD